LFLKELFAALVDYYIGYVIVLTRARKGSFKNKKSHMAGKIASYLRETKEELIRVSWPSRQIVLKHTLLVVGISLGLALFLGAADYVFAYGLTKIITR
jgi:preprotein translocase SecE subunit